MARKEQVSLAELEFTEIGGWPLEYRMTALLIVGVLTIFLAYLLLLKSSFSQLTSFAMQKSKLITTFAENYQQSSNLDAYKKQMGQIQKMLQSILQKLPSKGEIPMLLEDISQQALAAGLTFELIKPEDPIDKGFVTVHLLSLKNKLFLKKVLAFANYEDHAMLV